MLESNSMDIVWFGQACFKLKGKEASAVIDPYDSEFTGLKLPKDLEANLSLKTHDHQDHSNLAAVSGEEVQISGPGEYEVKGISVVGVSTFHDKTEGSERGKNVVYNIEVDGLNIVHLGDLGHTLSEEQVLEIGTTDVLLIPVGGTYTIDAKDAAEVVAQLEPKIIIPMHYALPDLKFPLEGVDGFLKEMGAENITPVNKLTITKEKLPEEPQVVLLNKS